MIEKNKKPSIRFKGFSDNWVQYKLGELGSVAMNRRIFKDQTSEDGEIPFYKIGTFGSKPDAFISRELFEEYKAKYSYPKDGDILISASGSIGRTVEYTGADEYFQDSNIVWLEHDERLNNSFLKQFYSVVKWKGLEGSTIQRLYNKNILDTEIFIPQSEEQRKIGEYFKQLDNIIILHQHKYDKLINFKKAMLEKMFPKNGCNVPEIRFKGFTDDWEQRNWEETVDISTDMVDPKTGKYDELFHIGPGNIESFSGKILNNVQNVKDSNLISGKFYFKKGDIIYGKINPQLAKYAIAPFEGLASADSYVLNTKNGVVQNYLYTILQTRDFYKYSVSVSARTGMPKINRDELNIYNFLAPSMAEQQKIGELFVQLDNYLALHQQELEKLKNIKKACLEKML